MGRKGCSQHIEDFLIQRYKDLIFKYSYAYSISKLNLQQQERFYQFMNRVKANERSRGASSGIEDKRITEVVNGIITTRPAKKIEYLSEETQQGPEIIELTKSKAGSLRYRSEQVTGNLKVSKIKRKALTKFKKIKKKLPHISGLQ